MFTEFDQDQDGLVGIDEVRRITHALGHTTSKAILKNHFNKFDDNGGHITDHHNYPTFVYGGHLTDDNNYSTFVFISDSCGGHSEVYYSIKTLINYVDDYHNYHPL